MCDIGLNFQSNQMEQNVSYVFNIFNLIILQFSKNKNKNNHSSICFINFIFFISFFFIIFFISEPQYYLQLERAVVTNLRKIFIFLSIYHIRVHNFTFICN